MTLNKIKDKQTGTKEVTYATGICYQKTKTDQTAWLQFIDRLYTVFVGDNGITASTAKVF